MKKILLALFLVPTVLFAQYTEAEKSEEGKSIKEKDLEPLTDFKNTIRWNMTPMVLFGYRNVNLGYERVLSDKSTASINVGYLEIPIIFTTSEQIEYVEGNRDRGGFSIFLDYKRYINNRNKRSAPEGVYWGAFTGIYNQKFRNNYKASYTGDDGTEFNGEADINTKINSINFGLELGYQFVFYDRFTVDLILMGPATSIYAGKLTGKFSGNLNESEEFKNFVDNIYDKIPWLENAINGDRLYAEGNSTNFALFGSNFRYVLQVGYRF